MSARITRREERDENYLNIARAAAGRADCSRRQVGAVIVSDDRIVSVGRNGSPPGGKSCLKGECPRGLSNVEPGSSYDTGPGTCIALHAEQNAVMRAAWDDMQGATMYLTDKPCEGCWRTIQGSGLARVTWATPEGLTAYRTEYARGPYPV